MFTILKFFEEVFRYKFNFESARYSISKCLVDTVKLGCECDKKWGVSLIDTTLSKSGQKTPRLYDFGEAFEIDLSHEFQLYTFTPVHPGHHQITFPSHFTLQREFEI